MGKSKQRQSLRMTVLYIGLFFVFVIVLFGLLLRGRDVALLSPRGYVASEQHKLFLTTITILFAIGIPTLVIFYYTAYRYRENSIKPVKSTAKPYSKSLVFTIWAIPTMFMLLLSTFLIPSTHRLAPQKNLDDVTTPLTIQVVAMRWKWLFIYPKEGIATVNYVQIPNNTPVTFELTADEAPMNSFWIPHLGGQLYAMTGHDNKLNLMADTIGDYTGKAAEINGDGFAGMTFKTRVTSSYDFEQWVDDTGHSANILDSTIYNDLLKPSQNNVEVFYRSIDPALYTTILQKYESTGTHEHSADHTDHTNNEIGHN